MSKNKMPYEGVKRLLKFTLALVAIGLLVFAFIPEKLPVDITLVEKGDLTISVEGEGKRVFMIFTPFTLLLTVESPE